MSTIREMIENAAPGSKWILENIQKHTSGPVAALVAIELAKRSILLLACEGDPESRKHWEIIEREFDKLVFFTQPGSGSFEFRTIDKGSDA